MIEYHGIIIFKGGIMRKKLLIMLIFIYVVSVGLQFWEGYFPKLTYSEVKNTIKENSDKLIVEDETTIQNEISCGELAAMENENANAKTKPQIDEDQLAIISESIAKQKQTEIPQMDYEYIVKNFYQVDKATYIGEDELNMQKLMASDMSIQKSEVGPDILIYHTHSQEAYSDSATQNESDTVVGVGNLLEKLLTEKYGYKVMHHKGEYDVGDRDHAYSNALSDIKKIIEENPTIQVVIDLHRDGVAESTRLATTINNKPTAMIMFFNGLCRTSSQGNIESLPNKYLEQNLAFSFQLQLAANQYYPGFARRIYLKGYRYNMHLCPKSLLVEVGAQTNTKEEALNAMEPLADILNRILTEK